MENNKKQQSINTPTAIIVAGVLIMIAILITNGNLGNKLNKEKTLSEQVGVNKDKFTQCMKDTDLNALLEKTSIDAENAMKGIPAEQRGTPYSVIIGKNGFKAEIRGAYPKEEIKKLIEEVIAEKITIPYTGEISAVTSEDHIIGSMDAPVVIIEYSDLECPYCKKFGETMKEIVAESNDQVAWVYRHWIVHPGALPKAGASECVASIKGEDAFWKYIDLVFGLMQTEKPVASTDNL
jgi:protein-disulfide isomerase